MEVKFNCIHQGSPNILPCSSANPPHNPGLVSNCAYFPVPSYTGERGRVCFSARCIRGLCPANPVLSTFVEMPTQIQIVLRVKIYFLISVKGTRCQVSTLTTQHTTTSKVMVPLIHNSMLFYPVALQTSPSHSLQLFAHLKTH